jgi:hypothetical protein
MDITVNVVPISVQRIAKVHVVPTRSVFLVKTAFLVTNAKIHVHNIVVGHAINRLENVLRVRMVTGVKPVRSLVVSIALGNVTRTMDIVIPATQDGMGSPANIHVLQLARIHRA